MSIYPPPQLQGFVTYLFIYWEGHTGEKTARRHEFPRATLYSLEIKLMLPGSVAASFTYLAIPRPQLLTHAGCGGKRGFIVNRWASSAPIVTSTKSQALQIHE